MRPRVVIVELETHEAGACRTPTATSSPLRSSNSWMTVPWYLVGHVDDELLHGLEEAAVVTRVMTSGRRP